MSSTDLMKGSIKVKWDAKPSSFPEYKIAVDTFMLQHDLSPYLHHLQVVTTIDIPNGNTWKRGNAKVFGYLSESVKHKKDLSSIISKYERKEGDAAVTALGVGPTPQDIATARESIAVGYRSQRLWDAIILASTGPVKSLAEKIFISR